MVTWLQLPNGVGQGSNIKLEDLDGWWTIEKVYDMSIYDEDFKKIQQKSRGGWSKLANI